MFRPTEDVDYVNPLTRLQDIGQMIEIGDCLLPQDRSSARCDRNDSVTEALELLRHTVAGSRRVRGQSNNGDDPRRTQELCDLVGGWVFEHVALPTRAGGKGPGLRAATM
jgi:hypothetical protein